MTELRVHGLRLEQVPPGEPIGSARPRLSWTLMGDPTASLDPVVAEVEWQSQDGRCARAPVEPTAILLPWPFRDLRSGESGSVRVRVGDGQGQWTPWSEPCPFLVGLLEARDWVGSMITPATIGGLDQPAPILAKTFRLSARPSSARVWITALGIYVLHVNGERVGNQELAPGWTAYEHRLRYQSFDVSGFLREGQNTIEITLGNGWYRGNLTWEMTRTNYGDRLAALAQLHVTLETGQSVVIATDGSWHANLSDIVGDDLYNGERQDRLRGRVDSRDGVEVIPMDAGRLIARRGPAVAVTEEVSVVEVVWSDDAGMLVDFGQNLVGRVRVTVRGGDPGDEVTIRHAEVLENGELALRLLGHAKASCSYVLSGSATEVLAPAFTFSGFRYALIEGSKQLSPDDIVAEVIGTDLVPTGSFECDDPDLNQLHRNVVWGARGNFLDLPTDCPQRAERLGWTGDIQAFASTANFLFDTSGFLGGWLEDLSVEQREDGAVPWIVPNVYPGTWEPEAGWGDAATVVPLALHDTFADDDMLRRQYPSMRGWVDKVTSLADHRGVWHAKGLIGDWLDPDAPGDQPQAAKADPAVSATAYFFHSAQLLAEAARRLGEADDHRTYSALAKRISAGFEREFLAADDRLRSDCQTVYALAIVFGVVADQARREAMGRRLAELVELADATVATGFLGTPHILEALCMVGRSDLAHRMLRQTRPPSWLYAVRMGATTVWERWDAMLPDGRIHPSSMTSFNHYAYGAVADFLHRRVGGLRPLEPGYRRFAVAPVPGGLGSASVTLDSVSGRIAVRWAQGPERFELCVEVPFGTVAEVLVPGAPEPIVCSWGVHRLTRSAEGSVTHDSLM